MNRHRRDVLTGFGGLAVAATGLCGSRISPSTAQPKTPETVTSPALPRKADFNIEEGYTYINAAYTHPIPRVSLSAAREAAEHRGALRSPRPTGHDSNPKEIFAELIGAQPQEIAYV